MNEKVWHKIFQENIECYEAIQLLGNHSILDEEEVTVCEHNLLHNIIEGFRSEVEE